MEVRCGNNNAIAYNNHNTIYLLLRFLLYCIFLVKKSARNCMRFIPESCNICHIFIDSTYIIEDFYWFDALFSICLQNTNVDLSIHSISRLENVMKMLANTIMYMKSWWSVKIFTISSYHVYTINRIFFQKKYSYVHYNTLRKPILKVWLHKQTQKNQNLSKTEEDTHFKRKNRAENK